MIDDVILFPIWKELVKVASEWEPRFNKWWLEFDIIADDAVFNMDDIIQILAIAGGKIGLSDYRPRYGTFEFSIVK